MFRPFRPITLFVLALWACGAGWPAAQSKPPVSCDLLTNERVVAVGDVHGAFDKFVKILQEARIVDGRRRWIGGRAVLVQAGDFLDRGADSGKVVEFLRRLEGEASRAGGRVHVLLGNHETMRMLGDYRYVSAGEYAALRTVDSEDLRERYYGLLTEDNQKRARAAGTSFDERDFRAKFLEGTPLGFVEMQIAFGPRADVGRWLRARDTMVRINGVVFMHGGPTLPVATLGCAAVNTQVRAELGKVTLVDPNFGQTLIGSPDGPLWYRGLVDGSATVGPADVEAILAALAARAVVVGHTVAPGFKVTARFDGRVIQIDTGMLGGDFYPGGVASALEIKGEAWTAVYEGRREAVR